MGSIPSQGTVVIFGGSGFVGKHLISLLQRENYAIHVADLVPPGLANVIYHECDVRDKINFSVKDDVDIVFNLAAVHRTPGHDDDEYFVTNVGGALNIVEWCENHGVKQILFTSSISVYGPGDDLKDENSRLSPIHAYGKSKKMAEDIFNLWYLKDVNARSLHICRPAVIFGPGENGNYARMARAIKRGVFFIPGSRNIVKSSGYVRDLARSFLFMLEQGHSREVYNFCFPGQLTIGEIASTMATVGKFRKPLAIPLKRFTSILKRLGLPFSHLALRIEKLLTSTAISPEVLLFKGFEWEHDLESSLKDWFDTSYFDNN